MFCHNCGTENKEDSTYCFNCGTKLLKVDTNINPAGTYNNDSIGVQWFPPPSIMYSNNLRETDNSFSKIVFKRVLIFCGVLFILLLFWILVSIQNETNNKKSGYINEPSKSCYYASFPEDEVWINEEYQIYTDLAARNEAMNSVLILF